MKKGLRRSPKQYPINTPEFLRTFTYGRPPTGKDYRRFRVTDIWIDTTEEQYGVYILVDKSNRRAIWINIGEEVSGIIRSASGDNGLPVLPDSNGNIKFLMGSPNVSVMGDPATNTIRISLTGQSGFMWQTDTTGPVNLMGATGHISNGSAPITYNLPSTVPVGTEFIICNINAGFTISANTGQSIRVGDLVSVAAGNVTSTRAGDCLHLVCSSPNTSFLVINQQGNFEVQNT